MKILIIEDEPAAARRIEKMIHELLPQAQIMAKLETIRDAVSWFQSSPIPDVVMMDIHLADGPCFDIFRQVDVKCPVIFTTAYDQYALQAFKVNSIDYLLKPVKKEELEFSFRKLQERKLESANPALAALLEQLASPIKSYQQRFIVRSGSLIKSIETRDVVAFYAEDKVNFILDANSRRYPTDLSLDKISELLDPQLFYRINRGIIIQYSFISQMHAHLKGRIKVEMKIPLPMEVMVSPDRAASFKAWLGR